MSKRVPDSPPTTLPLVRGAVTRSVFREPMVVAAGGRALLMQVAHPLVAAAVAQHSNYERDPWQRLARTLEVMDRMVFGSPSESQRQAASLARLHSSIAGEAPDGASYRASEPALLAWVWATLVDTALVAFESSRAALSRADRDRYYEEQKLIAQACGVPAADCPPSLRDFDDYVRRSITGDLQVTSEAKAIARAVLRPPLREPFATLAVGPFYLLNVGLLPESLREGYELPWSPAHEDLLRLWLLGVRRTNAVVPKRVRRVVLSVVPALMALAIPDHR